MAKKGKMKISKVKRNNHTTNKMRKQGTLRLQRHRAKVQKQKQPQQSQEVEYSSESDSASGEEWADMLDADEQQYIMQRLATQPSLLSNVPEKEQVQRSKKRKREDKGKVPKRQQQNSDSGAETDDDSDSELEDKYEKEMSENPAKRMRPLLPIKTKHGLLERAEEVEDTESEQEESYQEEEPSKEEEQPQDSESDSGMEGTVEDNEAGDGETISAVQLLAARRDKLQHDKLRIGALCSSLLESPEKKLKNFFPILYLMEERLKDNTLNLHSVRKLATLSAYEVFKDILPDYMIRHQDYSNIKLKKDTLALYKYEKELVEFYKRYLQRLEKAAMVLRRKKGDTKKPDEPTISLALVSLRCMCGMLEARPQFNYAANIAQSVVPYLDCREDQAREIVTECCRTVFGEDQKGEITLAIVRLINQLVKRRGERLHPAALDCLLSLRIRDVDMDAAADLQHKKKQDSKHKKRIVNLSKKEKKRAKKLKEVERELLETEAQESELARRKQLTEVTKTVFHVYFRLLKTAPRSRLLAAALKGLTKFTHVINMEYYSDLVAILSRLVEDELIGPRERLLCVRTVLGVLAGAGDALTVDPAKFHQHLYASAIGVHAGASQSDARIVLEAVWQICSRARRVSPAVLQAFAKRLTTLAAQTQHHAALAALALLQQLAQRVSAVLQAFAKRLATLAAQTQHHAALAALALLQQLAQQSKAVSNLLEPDSEAGSGRFEPLLPSPEHCNAHAAALHELCAMRTHYHPVVRQQAAALMQAGNVAELNKLSPLQIFDAYDGSKMAFKPAIPPPKKSDKPKSKSVNHGHTWVQNDFKTLCENVENSVGLVIKNSNR